MFCFFDSMQKIQIQDFLFQAYTVFRHKPVKVIQAHESDKENIFKKVTSSIILRFFDLETTQEITITPQTLSMLGCFHCAPSNSLFRMIFTHHQPKLFSGISMHNAVSRNKDLSSVELLLPCYCSTTAVL